MNYKTYITTALVAATGLALAMPVVAQTATVDTPAAPIAETARPTLFDFAKLDTNADGKLTMEEITAARDAATSTLDANADGKIDASELTAYQMAQVEERSKLTVAALDADGDGALSAAELAGHQIVRLPPTLPQAVFDRIDADKDGAISQDEFDAAKLAMQNRMQTARNDNPRANMNPRSNMNPGDKTNGRSMRDNAQTGRHDRQGNQDNAYQGRLPFWHR
ncbi:EF-hand domain-containing protein [Phaeovulum sp.]|uniref:EF-hand domain-containing protein n=1 Tax=Phaeovulum sp. TaxID=2934796 RepID=UPI0035656804